ncbi:ComEC/Rec2 family competence protein [Paraburkholderia guartelaensis]|uniref:hypothetical protein n=1 Tax=Paraburkholderia guartelaensis TaxID=2546446 RepID=UPI002AB7AABF|nr:hypothetical protein [Paraburkholderia guartelaensis]
MRYFAVLESLDDEGDTPQHVYLDCVAEPTFKMMLQAGGINQVPAAMADEYMGAVLQVRRDELEPQLLDRINAHSTRLWLQFTVSDERDEDGSVNIPATFVSLASTADALEVPPLYISPPTPAGDDMQNDAERIFRHPQVGRAAFERFAGRLQALFSREEQRHVVAYYVGQGNCNAIVDQVEHPVMFFDLGWPIQTNIAGAPSPAPRLFDIQAFDEAPPVVLSHWDWDHWAYALESWSYDRNQKAARARWKPGALERPWLVPAPDRAMKLGPSHYLLIMKLFQQRYMGRRALHYWPKKMDTWDAEHLTIIKCHTKKKDVSHRNNSGLAMIVRIDDGRKTGLVLLPGDSEFDSMHLGDILPEDTGRLVGMVASHHGGKLNVFSIPETKAPNARLVVSTGKNGYGHPNTRMLENYGLQGWKDQCHTNYGGIGRVGATLVQPESFDKPICRCGGAVEAGMSSNLSELPADYFI